MSDPISNAKNDTPENNGKLPEGSQIVLPLVRYLRSLIGGIEHLIPKEPSPASPGLRSGGRHPLPQCGRGDFGTCGLQPLSHVAGSSMHTSQHGMCCAEGFEPSEAVAHGEGSGRTFRGVSFPAAEAGDDPGGPRQGTGGMRVLLLWGSPFESGLVEGEGVDFLGREDLLGRDRRGAVTGADELHDTGRREGAEEGEFDEGLSALDLTGLDVETLAL